MRVIKYVFCAVVTVCTSSSLIASMNLQSIDLRANKSLNDSSSYYRLASSKALDKETLKELRDKSPSDFFVPGGTQCMGKMPLSIGNMAEEHPTPRPSMKNYE